jgi:exopolysaccharide biosynthesis polyprenyl glycosylphosphotransferase
MTRIFGHSVRSETFFLTITDVLAVFTLVFALTALTGSGEGTGAFTGAAIVALGVAVCAILVGGAVGLYRPTPQNGVRQRFVSAAAGSVMLLALIALLLDLAEADGGVSLSLQLVLATLSGAVVAMTLTRLGLAIFSRPVRRIAVLGSEDGAALQKAYAPFEVTLALPRPGALEDALNARRLQAWKIDTIVGANPAMLTPQLRERCAREGLQCLSRAEFAELGLNKVDLEGLAPGWLAGARAAHTSVIEAALRRAFDVSVALVILLFTLPLMLVTMLAIRLDGPGPIFYRQERIGLGNRPFTLFKFRSMVVDAERGGAPKWATRSDPRVTRVGRFLRLTRIDEIPQVLNVLRGDMSIVGPRPERPAFVEQLAAVIPHYNDRAVVKPGITGWAQVSFPYGASVEDARTKLEYDLYYVRRRSLFLDLLILLATVRVVLFQEGAR